MALHPADPRWFPIVIDVRTAPREDGGLRVWSDDLPGLILSAKNASELEESIPLAIEELVRALGFGLVKARRGSSLPHSAHRDHLSYVVTAAAPQ
jgi:hypothetical protein